MSLPIDRLEPLRSWSRDHPLELVGPPGVGKSWVARQWARELADVLWMSLDGVRSAEGVVHQLAVELDLDDDQAAFRALAARAPTAWVLDDAEAAADALLSLQDRFPPGVPVVLTSRRRVGLRGSSVVDVEPLDLPAAKALFVASARAAHHGFDPASHEAAIAELCRELDGLPLAIELAAARVRVLSPEQIAERLTLDQLTDRRRRGRHHSLRQALAGALEALSEEARSTLSAASVFLGPFTLEALEAAGAGSVAELEELMDAGLLQRVDDGALRLLGPVRVAAEELRLADRPALALRVHQWLVSLPEARDPNSDASFWQRWRQQLERAAAQQGEVAARAALALARREERYGPIGGQSARCAHLLHDETVPADLRARLYRTLAAEGIVRTEYDATERALAAGLALEPSASVRGELLLSQAQMLSDRRSGVDESLAVLDAAREAFGSDPERQADVALIRSIALLRVGRVEGAVVAARDALAAVSAVDAPHLEALCLAFLADAERHAGVAAVTRLGRLDRAASLPVGPPKYRALLATKRATALADAGRMEDAIEVLERPTRRLEESGDHLFAVGNRLLQVAFALGAGDAAQAQGRLEVVPPDLPHYAGVLRTLRTAQLAHATGDVGAARAGYGQVRGLEEPGYRAMRAEADAFCAALDGERVEGLLLDGVLERAHAGPALQEWVEERGRWEARLLARLLRPAVRVAASGRWFQVGSERHELGRKTTLIRVLAGLAARTGRPVPVDEVLAFGWPGESPKGNSGRARVHVTISSLRKLGLQGALWTAPGEELAYVLDAEAV